MHIVTFVFKCVHNNAPDLFKEYFVKTSHNIPLGVMVSISLFQRYLLNLLRKAVTFSELRFLINYHRVKIKEIESLLIFKTLIKDFSDWKLLGFLIIVYNIISYFIL